MMQKFENRNLNFYLFISFFILFILGGLIFESFIKQDIKWKMIFRKLLVGLFIFLAIYNLFWGIYAYSDKDIGFRFFANCIIIITIVGPILCAVLLFSKSVGEYCRQVESHS